jgi:hypothetical protein
LDTGLLGSVDGTGSIFACLKLRFTLPTTQFCYQAKIDRARQMPPKVQGDRIFERILSGTLNDKIMKKFD